MREAVANLEFEEAARLRDEIRKLDGEELVWASARPSPSPAGAVCLGAPPPPARATTSAARLRPRRNRDAGPGRR